MEKAIAGFVIAILAIYIVVNHWVRRNISRNHSIGLLIVLSIITALFFAMTPFYLQHC
jgi:hypothetical protein